MDELSSQGRMLQIATWIIGIFKAFLFRLISMFQPLLYNTTQYNKDSRLPTIRTRANYITLRSISCSAYKEPDQPGLQMSRRE